MKAVWCVRHCCIVSKSGTRRVSSSTDASTAKEELIELLLHATASRDVDCCCKKRLQTSIAWYSWFVSATYEDVTAPPPRPDALINGA
jgi:hypothetical protein